MITNRVNVIWNRKKIEDTYMIFELKKREAFQTSFLDDFKGKHKAVSMCYNYGGVAFTLFYKSNTLEKELRYLYPDILITERKVNDLSEPTLLQLILNSMKKDEKYHNITGKLFYGKQKSSHDGDVCKMLSVDVKKDMTIVLSVKSFRKDPKGTYCVDPYGNFRKKRKDDKDVISYSDKTGQETREQITAFDIKSFSDFESTKMGAYVELLYDIKECLNDYITVSFVEEEMETKKMKIPSYDELFRSMQCIYIVNDTTEPVNDIVEILEEYGIKGVVSSEFVENAYHIHFIHNEEHYKLIEKEDRYVSSGSYIIQNITMEEFFCIGKKKVGPLRKKQKQMIKKALFELLVKKDILNNKISFWNQHSKPWYFITRDSLDKGKKYLYNILKIESDGTFTFEQLSDDETDRIFELVQYMGLYERANLPKNSYPHEVEGVFYEEGSVPHIILRTDRVPLPNIQAIYQGMIEANPNDKILVSNLIDCLKDYDGTSELVEQLQSFNDDYIEKKDVSKLINMRSNFGKKINRLLHDEKGLWINAELRSHEYDPVYQFENITDIKWKETEHEYIYVVCPPTKDKTYVRFNKFRKIYCMGRKIEANSILELLQVGFVRNEQFTVLPYPFKYIRELAQIAEKE